MGRLSIFCCIRDLLLRNVDLAGFDHGRSAAPAGPSARQDQGRLHPRHDRSDAGRGRAAQGILARIRRGEAQWRLGAHPVIRFAHVVWAGLTSLFFAVPALVLYYHLTSRPKPSSLAATLRFMFETP